MAEKPLAEDEVAARERPIRTQGDPTRPPKEQWLTSSGAAGPTGSDQAPGGEPAAQAREVEGGTVPVPFEEKAGFEGSGDPLKGLNVEKEKPPKGSGKAGA